MHSAISTPHATRHYRLRSRHRSFSDCSARGNGSAHTSSAPSRSRRSLFGVAPSLRRTPDTHAASAAAQPSFAPRERTCGEARDECCIFIFCTPQGARGCTALPSAHCGPQLRSCGSPADERAG